MMADHTPGPWVAIRIPTPSDDGLDYAIGANVYGKSDVVAVVLEKCGLDEELSAPASANARLIAAAPDLLAALLDAQEFITASDHSGNNWQKAVEETMADAIDAAWSSLAISSH
jgi:hypothetical protein